MFGDRYGSRKLVNGRLAVTLQRFCLRVAFDVLR
jgi:hypothetical protein